MTQFHVRKNTTLNVDVNYYVPRIHLSNVTLTEVDDLVIQFEGLSALTKFIKELNSKVWGGIETLNEHKRRR